MSIGTEQNLDLVLVEAKILDISEEKKTENVKELSAPAEDPTIHEEPEKPKIEVLEENFVKQDPAAPEKMVENHPQNQPARVEELKETVQNLSAPEKMVENVPQNQPARFEELMVMVQNLSAPEKLVENDPQNQPARFEELKEVDQDPTASEEAESEDGKNGDERCDEKEEEEEEEEEKEQERMRRPARVQKKGHFKKERKMVCRLQTKERCKNSNCAYAHKEDLDCNDPNKVDCMDFSNGKICPHGFECKFFHHLETDPCKNLTETGMCSGMRSGKCKKDHKNKLCIVCGNICADSKHTYCVICDNIIFGAIRGKHRKVFYPDACKYYMQGTCKKGENCKFEHSIRACYHFTNGSCKYGSNCNFLHVAKKCTDCENYVLDATDIRCQSCKQSQKPAAKTKKQISF